MSGPGKGHRVRQQDVEQKRAGTDNGADEASCSASRAQTPPGRLSPARRHKKGRRMRIERRYTKDGQPPYADIEFRLTTSEIRNPDGSVVFRADAVEVPAFWSQVASDVLAQKYFRKAGVPALIRKVEENTV